MSRPRGTTSQNLNLWAMMNNVIIAALAKGQLLPVLLFFLFVLMILKMPANDVSTLLFKVLADLEKGQLWGYVATPVLTMSWYFHARFQRRAFEDQMRIMADSRDKAEKKLLPGLIESSQPGRKKGGKQ